LSKSARQPLPDILRRRPKHDDSQSDVAGTFEAMVIHFGLTDAYELMKSKPDQWPHGGRRAAFFWSALALALMSRQIPAYGTPNTGRRKVGAPLNVDAWINAGGRSTLLTGPSAADMTRFYQAQFVEAVRKIEIDKKKSRQWVFKWLANKTEIVGAAAAARRMALLPQLYRKRTAAGSLRTTFNAIPSEVRRDPKAFLPKIGR
jgi:hypothetical protein